MKIYVIQIEKMIYLSISVGSLHVKAPRVFLRSLDKKWKEHYLRSSKLQFQNILLQVTYTSNFTL